MTMYPVTIGSITIGAGHPLVLIGGPCAIEGESFMLDVASRLRDITTKAAVPFIFQIFVRQGQSYLNSFLPRPWPAERPRDSAEDQRRRRRTGVVRRTCR